MTDDRAHADTPGARPLPETADAVVVGGGIAGTSAAWHLARTGADVVLLERDRVGRGATDAAVGVLSPPLRQPFHETVHDRGPEEAAAIWRFAERSIVALGEALAGIGASSDVALDLAGGYVLAERHTDHQVQDSFAALDDAGFDVEWLGAKAARSACGGRGFTGGYRLATGGALSPGPTARALAADAAERGCVVVEGAEVEAVRAYEGGVECAVAGGRSIRAPVVVYATHVESGRFSRLLEDAIVPIRGQGFAARLPESVGTIGSFTTHWKLNVWRKTPGGRLLVGGWRHSAWDRAYRQTAPELDDRLQRDLQEWFEAVFPEAAPLEVLNRWSGIFGWTADYLPLVGALPGSSRELVVSGFSGGGLPFAFEGGRVVAAMVAGSDLPDGAELFDPARFRP